VGVIDLGSNSARLVLAEAVPGLPPRILAEEREPVRLGENVFHTGMLNRQAVERTQTALKRFAAVAKARGVARLACKGTCALREAEDRLSFVQRVRDEAGLEVEVLTGHDEARLIAKGVLSGMADRSGEWVMVDMGGGSVEVIRAMEGTITDVASLKLGAVRLSEMFLRSDPPAPAELELLRAHARTTARNVMTFSLGTGGRVMGSAGTINALLAVAHGGRGPQVISVDTLEEVVDSLCRMSLARRKQVPQLEAKRADIIVAGGLALLEVLRLLGARNLEVTRLGLKEGLLLDAVESLGVSLPSPTEPERVRLDGALAVVRRYSADEAHAAQVAALACKLFEGLKSVHRMDDEARSELEVAALLHDIGQFVTFEKHHKHSAYLIANSNLPGFSDQARARVAAIARYHRRAEPDDQHAEWQSLSKTDRARVRSLAALLRIADGLDRGHHHVVKDLRVEVRRREVRLRVLSGGPADMEAWAAAEKADLFRSVFDRTLHVEIQQATSPRPQSAPLAIPRPPRPRRARKKT
jgi:exopolyphosphatase/guanosine-5'-triphosphate,3'-diphosphate pyrophosphatase